jgi:hypothetical protein
MSAALDRGRLVEALQRGPRLPLGQAGRSFVQRSDLRQPLRRRGRRRLHPHLVPRPPAERRLSRARCNALPGPPGGAFACRGQANPALHAAASTSPSPGASTSSQPTCREAAFPDRRRSAFPHWRLYRSGRFCFDAFAILSASPAPRHGDHPEGPPDRPRLADARQPPDPEVRRRRCRSGVNRT